MLKEEINELRNSPISETVNTRLKEFESFENKDYDEWFSELCFCILTANARARTALQIQRGLGGKGFMKLPKEQLTETIKRAKHRFHNNKAKFIIEARKNYAIRDIVKKMDDVEAREWIVENVKGLGYKEASHFLRNTGRKNLAILDRHILNLMLENEYIDRIPLTLDKRRYLKIEESFIRLAKVLEMSPAELDLYMWYMKTGEVLK